MSSTYLGRKILDYCPDCRHTVFAEERHELTPHTTVEGKKVWARLCAHCLPKYRGPVSVTTGHTDKLG